MKALLLAMVGFAALGTGAAQTNAPAPTPARLAWWRDARFGLFIHYGPVTLTGKEISWSRANSNPQCPNHGQTPVAVYDQLYQDFNPTHFDAQAWTDLARAAGMKYVVLTAKHCDGFLLWDSHVDGYNIMATPFHRDLCAELARAVHQNGLRLGWYFSPPDWRDPDFRTARNATFLARMQGELRELMSGYGRVDLVWFDCDGKRTAYDAPATYRLVQQLQPDIIFDNRLVMGSMEDYRRQAVVPPADYYTPEQHIGAYDDQVPWETCMTLGIQWSWKPGDKIKSVREVVDILAHTVGGDGNLLLNVGPMPDGRIEPRQAAVLKAVGAWLQRNGESIYGTRGGPWKPAAHVVSTRKGQVVYLHLLPGANGQASLPALPVRVQSATLMNGTKVDFHETDNVLTVTVAQAGLLDPDDTVVRLQLAGSALDLPAQEPLTTGAAPPAK